jgi:hypothetical protein
VRVVIPRKSGKVDKPVQHNCVIGVGVAARLLIVVHVALSVVLYLICTVLAHTGVYVTCRVSGEGDVSWWFTTSGTLANAE